MGTSILLVWPRHQKKFLKYLIYVFIFSINDRAKIWRGGGDLRNFPTLSKKEKQQKQEGIMHGYGEYGYFVDCIVIGLISFSENLQVEEPDFEEFEEDEIEEIEEVEEMEEQYYGIENVVPRAEIESTDELTEANIWLLSLKERERLYDHWCDIILCDKEDSFKGNCEKYHDTLMG